jgi:thermitase
LATPLSAARLALAAVALWALALPSAAAPLGPTPGDPIGTALSHGGLIEGELLVKWRDLAARERLLRSGVELIVDDWSGQVSRVRTTSGGERAMARRLESLDGVLWAEQDAVVQVFAIPNDPAFEQQWALRKIDAPRAWDLTTGSPQVVVAVLDSGVDLQHPEFAGRLVPGFNARDPNAQPQDDYGHGTHVAGTIAAAWNNGVGVAGIAPASRIMPIKVLDSRGLGRASDVATAIRWAVENGAWVINMSFGTEQRVRALTEAVDFAVSSGTIMVVAVGNDTTTVPNFPAASPNVIAVGSTSMDDRRTSFSNYGSWVDLAAPGVGIVSTWWTSTGPTYRSDTGTSMSAPHVSGVVALMLALKPDLTEPEIESVLRLTSDPVGGDCGIGPGRINAGRAIAAVANPASAPDVLRPRPSAIRLPAAISYDTPLAAPRVFLPYVVREVNGWTTEIRVQNPGATSVSGSVRFIAEDGCMAGEREFTLLPFATLTTTVSGEIFDPATWRGAAVVSASGPVSAVVAGHRPGGDSFGYDGRGAGSEAAYGPLVFKNRGGWTSTLHVQNLANEPATVELSYRSSTGQSGSWNDRAVIPPQASHMFKQDSLPDDFAGAVVARSAGAQPLALVVASSNADGSATAYSGASQGVSSLVAPVVFKNRSSNGRWNSGIQLQNLGSQPAAVSIAYRASGGDESVAEQRAEIGVGEARTFYQPDVPGLPENFVGSATVTVANQQPVLGLVNQVNYERSLSSAYELLGSGNAAGSAPLIVRATDGFDTGLQIQNLGDEPARVNVYYRNVEGALIAIQADEIPVASSRTYYQPAISGFPAQFSGTATFASTNSQPLAAVVNDIRY